MFRVFRKGRNLSLSSERMDEQPQELEHQLSRTSTMTGTLVDNFLIIGISFVDEEDAFQQSSQLACSQHHS